MQYALDTVTRDGTNGDQFNIKAGTDEVLTATLSFATYGTPTSTAPLIFRGYTSAANDGGIGGISGAGAYSITSSPPDYVMFFDMHLHNSGSSTILAVDRYAIISNCEINNTTGIGIHINDQATAVFNCYIHNCGSAGAYMGGAGNSVMFCTFENDGSNDFSSAIVFRSTGQTAAFNLIKLDGSSKGIDFSFSGVASATICNNSIYSNAGTGTGLFAETSGGRCYVFNNLVEGFSGTGGKGASITGTANHHLIGYNDVYNCATAFNITSTINFNLGNNNTLTSSPFINAASNDFSPKYNVNSGWPPSWAGFELSKNLVRGAIQAGLIQPRARYILGVS